MEKDSKICIVGENNISGIGLICYFLENGFTHVLSDSACSLDVLDQQAVQSFFEKEKPEYVFLTHIKSGGIGANIKYPGDFIYTNLQVQNTIIHSSYTCGVKKLLFFGSSCVYPLQCPQPIKEEFFLSGALEKTSEAYAVAKIAGIKMCQAYNTQYGTRFMSLIPATIYGPNDHFDLEHSHVMSSLIRKFHEAKANNEITVSIWGTGKPRREFIYIDDLIDACVFLLDNDEASDLINVGSGSDISIQELAQCIQEIVGFQGEVIYDDSNPDGVFQKLLDNEKMTKLGWRARTSLQDGIEQTYQWYKHVIGYEQ